MGVKAVWKFSKKTSIFAATVTPNIHHWKALDKSFLMVFLKKIFHGSCKASDFRDASGQIFSFILRPCHIWMHTSRHDICQMLYTSTVSKILKFTREKARKLRHFRLLIRNFGIFINTWIKYPSFHLYMYTLF